VVVKSTSQRSANPLLNTRSLQQEKDFHIQLASHRFFSSGVSLSKQQFWSQPICRASWAGLSARHANYHALISRLNVEYPGTPESNPAALTLAPISASRRD
jgi:hypothetical protein